MTRTVVALYDDLNDAHQAVQELLDHRFDANNISVMGYDANGQYGEFLKTKGERAAPPTERGADAATGAGIGALIGGIGGLLVGLGALVIPGIGPVVAAGSLATALVGAGVGAAAGGLIGALVDVGIPEEEAGYYAEGIRRGGTLLVLHALDGQVEEAVAIMEAHNPVDVEERATQWQSEGWTHFNPEGEPYMPAATDLPQEPYTAYTAPSYATEGELPSSDVTPEGGTERPVSRRSYPEDIVQPPARGTRSSSGTTEDQYQATEMGAGREQEETFTAPGATQSTPGKWGSAGVSGGAEHREPPERSDTVGTTNRQEYTAKGASTTAGSEQETYKAEGVGRQRVSDEGKMHATEHPEADSIKGPQGQGYTQSGLSSDRAVEGPDMEYEQGFRSHYDMTYKQTGRAYESYQPAYRYGYGLANDPRYRGRNWDDIEMEVQRDWEAGHANEGAWDDVKDAIRKGWNSIKRTLT